MNLKKVIILLTCSKWKSKETHIWPDLQLEGKKKSFGFDFDFQIFSGFHGSMVDMQKLGCRSLEMYGHSFQNFSQFQPLHVSVFLHLFLCKFSSMGFLSPQNKSLQTIIYELKDCCRYFVYSVRLYLKCTELHRVAPSCTE